MYKKLEIKNPCTQNWDDMNPLGTGKHCSSCNKVIHDFTNMDNNEHLSMLQSGKYSCGMFTKDQMGTIYLEKEKTNNRKKYWATIVASLLAGTLQLTVSYGQSPLRKNGAIVNDRLLEKNPQEKITTTVTKIEKEKKQLFSFRIVDSETKQPLNNVQIEVMGITAHTDSLGRVDYEFEYKEGESVTFISLLYLNGYNEKRIKLNLNTCFKKLTILYMDKKKKQDKEYLVLGQWG
jgi:hypothetical protein